MSACKDLTGQKFGLLVVIERAGSSPSGNALWRCACSCGAGMERVVKTPELSSGDTRSCGCLRGWPGGIKAERAPYSLPRPARIPDQPKSAKKSPLKDPLRAFVPSAPLAPVDALVQTGTVRRRVERMLRLYGTGRPSL